jgi:hypothetical protein
MVKIYSFFLFFSVFLISGLKGQAPVMNPITGASVVCSPPSSAPVYSASASNSPTSYSWTVLPSTGVTIASPGSSVTSISFPTPNGSYTVVCYATNGSGTSSPVTFVVDVFETPNVTFSGATSFCQGSSTNIMASSTMMSASPTISYIWSPPTGLNTTSGQFVSASPTTITNYTVTATNGACSNTGTITITPSPTPNVTASLTNTVVCSGDVTTLMIGGALAYTITPAVPISTPFPVYSSTTFTVTGSNTFGCYNKAYASVIVNPLPSISVNASPSLACMGQSVALTFGGTGTSYTLNTTPITGNSVAISPTVNTTYTISATNSFGCISSQSYTQYIGCVGITGPVMTEAPHLSVYPNPSAGAFNLNSGKDESVRIINELGQLVKQIELKADEKIKISDLSPGVYFVMSADTRIKIIVLE